MQAKPYNSICSLPNSFPNDVVIKIIDCAARCAKLELIRIGSTIKLVHLSLIKRVVVQLCTGRVQIFVGNQVLLLCFTSLMTCSLRGLRTCPLVEIQII